MRKVKHQEEEDLDAGVAVLGLAALAGLGIWAWRRKKAQVARPTFALLPRESQGQSQPAATSVAQLPRGDFFGARRSGSDRRDFPFVF